MKKVACSVCNSITQVFFKTIIYLQMQNCSNFVKRCILKVLYWWNPNRSGMWLMVMTQWRLFPFDKELCKTFTCLGTSLSQIAAWVVLWLPSGLCTNICLLERSSLTFLHKIITTCPTLTFLILFTLHYFSLSAVTLPADMFTSPFFKFLPPKM